MAFSIELTPRARDHLKHLPKRGQQTIVDAISRQLVPRPDRPTRHRKRLDENSADKVSVVDLEKLEVVGTMDAGREPDGLAPTATK